MKYATKLGIVATLVMAATLFSALMAWTTAGREQAAWAIGSGMLGVAGFTLATLWLLEDTTPTRK